METLTKLVEAGVVKTDPIFAFRPIGPVCIGLGLFWLGGWMVNGFQYPALLIGAPLLILTGVALWRYFFRWSNIERLRQVAALPENTLILPAQEQPDLDETALPLPATIEVRSTWKAPIICFLLLTFLTSSLTAWFLYEHPPQSEPSDAYTFAAIFLLVCAVLFSASIAALMLSAGYQRIEVTEQGLHVSSPLLAWRQADNQRFEISKQNGRIGSSKTMIPWNEAALFAVFPPHRISQRTYLPIIYELSGPKTIVRWMRVRQDMPWFHKNHQPTLPFDDYERQMEALLALIAAKTGLPLYDLRG